MNMKKSFIIAIDGSAGSGKKSISTAIAKHYNFAHLDTGLIYRAIALRAMNDIKKAPIYAHGIVLADLNDENLLYEEVAGYASIVAAMPEVRQAALEFQRNFAHNPPHPAVGAVLDGRDIGTVVCPEAQVKLFITVSQAERARRRYEQMQQMRPNSNYSLEDVQHMMTERDQRDASRAQAPLLKAPDAIEVDNSTELSVTLKQIFAIIDSHYRL